MLYRTDTNDWNTLSASLTQDEYGLKPLHLSGTAIDVGAYLGGVTVALAMDNPDLRVIAVEPVPPNVELLRRNVTLNGLDSRVEVIEAAIGDGKITVSYGYKGSESLEHHAFVGNSTLAGEFTGEATHEERTYIGYSLAGLVNGDVDRVSFLKIDCEGCEWQALKTLPPVERIHGEWHPVRSQKQSDVCELLPGFEVTFSGPDTGPGGFVAVRS